MTKFSAEAVTLRCIPYIKYLVQFRKDKTNSMQALINLGSKVNVMHPNYVKKLSLLIQKTDIRAQKINGSSLKTFDMVIAEFQI